MPDIENSRKNTSGSRQNSRKTAGKTAETAEKRPKNSQNSCFSGVSAVFPAVFGCFAATHSAPFWLFFRLFSMSGVAGRRDCNFSLRGYLNIAWKDSLGNFHCMWFRCGSDVFVDVALDLFVQGCENGVFGKRCFCPLPQ